MEKVRVRSWWPLPATYPWIAQLGLESLRPIHFPRCPLNLADSTWRCALLFSTTLPKKIWNNCSGVRRCCIDRCPSTLLPHAAPVDIYHRRSGLAVKCFLKFWHVGDHAVGPIFLRRKRI